MSKLVDWTSANLMVRVLLRRQSPAFFPSAGMLALDGRCKTLDAAADGYVRAENCITFLLAAGSVGSDGGQSNVAGVVARGSAVNQDGRSSSLTAPNGPAQQAAIRAALQLSSVKGSSVSGLEMHGTGTALGDPIEVGAATAVLQVGGVAELARVGGCPGAVVATFCNLSVQFAHPRSAGFQPRTPPSLHCCQVSAGPC